MNWLAKNWSSLLYLAVMLTIAIMSIVFITGEKKDLALTIGVPVLLGGSVLFIAGRVWTLVKNAK